MTENSNAAAQSTDAWTIARVLSWATGDLKQRGSASPRLDAELMLTLVLDCDRIQLVMDAGRPLEKDELAAYRALHTRRRRGEPVAYLRGYREFYKHTFAVDKRVLVPRPETELLVETAIRRTRHLSLSARVLDVCTGSGCVAITLKKLRPTTTVIASDVSADALQVAKHNAVRIGGLVGLFQSDVYESLEQFRGQLDIITANPPYISRGELDTLPVDVRDFEPHIALVAGDDGMEVTRRVVAGADDMLAPRGVLAVEVVAGKAGDAASLFGSGEWCDVEIERDYGGHERIVSARRKR